MKNYIYLDGKRIPISEETAKSIRDSQKEELNSFADCWNKVLRRDKPSWFISSVGYIEKGNLLGDDPLLGRPDIPNLPRKELARKVQLYIKLLVVAEALNDGWKKEGKGSYVYLNSKALSISSSAPPYSYGFVYFKDQETAEKAIEIAGDIFREYFEIR